MLNQRPQMARLGQKATSITGPIFFQAGHMMAPQRAAQVFEKHTDSIDRLPLQKCSYSRADGRS